LAAAALAALSAVASAEHPAVPGPGTMSALASSATPASLLATAPILVGDHVAEVDTGEGTAASDPDAWGSAEPVGFLESRKDGMPLSLFRGARHVVFRAKEEAVDRSHGHILLAGDQRGPDSVVMCATVSAAGVFLSNVAVGNSTENRLITVCRDPLSVQRASGLRILVRWEGAWRILGIPSVFTMDVGGCRWDYAIGDRRISVATVADPRDHTVRVSLRSDEALDVMAVVERVAGSVASGVPADGTTIVFGPGPDALAQRHCPGLALAVAVRDGMISDDGALFPDGAPRSAVHTTISASSTRAFDLVFSGALDGADAARDKARAAASSSPDVAADLEEHRTRLAQWTRRLRIAPGGRLAEFDVLVSWYAHDALVHLLSPHGLEQYSGAAWGTRDVLQGPYEFALALDRPEIARELLLRVLARQQADGSLPQWFMHDEYAEISQTDAHGDIVIWPLIALGQYLQATGDTGILAADVPFWDGDRQEPGRAPASVSDHLLATLKHLRDHRVPGTALPAYGGGDWDDSLQPLLPRLRSQMTSSWTTALLHQACQVLGLELEGAASDLAAEFAMEAGLLEEAFHRHLVIDGVVAGFVDFGSENERPLVHPRDRETGMRYRLVPMTRAVIAGLFTPEEADAHREIIERTLHYPDGVRLADAPAAYRDGATRLFLRAEQCANVGREIGLMYTHAHLRFVESLVALGRSAAAAELLRVSPVTPRRAAPHAALRQRNCYFSSSDADFPDRYTAAREWERLRAGSADPVAVRGGWRVYSSGPGIFLRMLVEGVLGLSVRRNELVVDPTLAPEDDGLEVELEIGGTLRTIRYRVAEGGDGVRVRGDGAVLPGRRLRRAYREGGVRIPLAALEGVSRIDVETPPGSDG
ncbi:MAG TPA: hypothetical protein VFS93_05880, partial [Terrimesophilobacter sp.]|nr:hypothetical protein [Terrimesophilobacter sp.]